MIALDLLGARKADKHYGNILEHLVSLDVGFHVAFHILEEHEKKLFSSFHGQYVDTGRLEESLTEKDGGDAIREAHGHTADFGSAVPYAVYQREDGESAVLPTPDAALRAEIAASMMAWIWK